MSKLLILSKFSFKITFTVFDYDKPNATRMFFELSLPQPLESYLKAKWVNGALMSATSISKHVTRAFSSIDLSILASNLCRYSPVGLLSYNYDLLLFKRVRRQKKKSKGGVSNFKKDQNAKGSSDIISTKKKISKQKYV